MTTRRTSSYGLPILVFLFVGDLLASIAMGQQSHAHQNEAFFETQIRPLLVEYCIDCHHADDPAGGLSLDSKAGWLRGGESGPAIVPHDPASSLLIRAISYADPDLKMPPPDSGDPLTPKQVEDITVWIRHGAYDPRDGRPLESDIDRRARDHWAFQSLRRPKLDGIASASNPIDFIVDSVLQSRNFVPTPRADLQMLVRRATFDLHGLPPASEQLSIADEDFPKLIDELLSSPLYGQRWARHWLDVARYSDAKDGVLMYGDARIRPFAYTYRDYVVRAFNDDKPFDQFVKEQLAADQLGLPPHSPDLAAMGFLTLGRMFDLNRHDVIDDQIDVVTRGFLGLTASCARCHDHKFDPIPTADYYSLYGIFASSIEPYEQPRIEAISPEGQVFESAYRNQLEQIAHTNQAHYQRTLQVARERTADYLVQVATTEPDLAETAIYFKSLLPEQLRPQITHRWRKLIAKRAFPDDPVFGPWYDLMRSPELQPDLWRSRGIDSRVIAAMLNANPKTPDEVARAYGTLLFELYQHRTSVEEGLELARLELAALDKGELDLADIVGGGSGLGTGQLGAGINPATGQRTTGEAGFIDGIQADVFVPVPDLPFVDGVFVPQGSNVPISSTEIRITDLDATAGKTWDYLKLGPSSGFTVTTIDDVDFASPPNSMLSIHANKGITFDIQAMREAYGFADCQFKCLLGNLGAKGESQLDFALYIDGKRTVQHKNVAAQQSGVPIAVELPIESRFLSIIVTEGAQGISHDQAILGNPRIVPSGQLAPEVKLIQYRQELVQRIASLEEQQQNLPAVAEDPLASLLISEESPIWFPIHQIEYYLSRQERDAYRAMVNQLDAIAVRHPHAAARALTLQDSEALYDPVIFQRGDPSQPGAPVPRAFLQCLAGEERTTFKNASGRLELAEAIANPNNPLTARVWVNRVWMHHFGQPLVDDPSDFGLRTAEPIQRELLDFLAATLLESEWRLKPLHRLIMTSQVWQRASLIPDEPRFREQLIEDPENRLLWHAERRRLDLEQMRDSLLAVSGQLDSAANGRPAPITDLANRRRTIYAFVERQNIPNVVQVFDFANADASTGKRPQTTVPQQALFAMNSPFMQQAAERVASRIPVGSSREQQIIQIFEITLGRKPDAKELQAASDFLDTDELIGLAHVLLMSNEFMFID